MRDRLWLSVNVQALKLPGLDSRFLICKLGRGLANMIDFKD